MDDLNHIQLPASLVTALFRTTLIDTGETLPTPKKTAVIAEEPVAPEKPATVNEKSGDGWKYLGQNQKNILVVVDYSNAVYLPDEELGFLTNMLTACKLSLGDVAIINRNNQQGGFKEAMAMFKSRIVLLFGVEPATFEMPLAFPHFQVQNFAGTTFLFSPTLEECRGDKLVKSKLWVCLQRIFAV